MFAGIVDRLQGAANGLVTLGFFEIQQYLDFRLIRSDLTFTAVDQTEIGAQLVLYARLNLEAVSTRVRDYRPSYTGRTTGFRTLALG